MKFFLLFIPFLVVQSVSAQQPIDSVSVNTDGTHKLTTRPKKTKQNVYVELGGAGLALSTNYDQRFRGANGLGFSAGIFGFDVFGVNLMGGQVALNYLIGKENKYLELGAGTNISLTDGYRTEFGLLPFAMIGYRYQPVKGFLFRATLTPIYIGGLAPWAGVSFGYAF
ncbi:MAG: hypothetical protein LBV41_11430 [Cytophagaceae bacterium]|jgi:hypothetical protein|nr:hypothetical protein [Cytophagaceae bacterium]